MRTHLDLFSGLGGFAIAARANGVRTVQFVEIDPRCRAFLEKAWPGVPVWSDIRSFSVANTAAICSGPRQPSGPQAGKKDSMVGIVASAECAERRQEAKIDHEHYRNNRGRPKAASGYSVYSSPIWLLTGGVPCQPASRAGKQRGKEDDRWLWPEALRVIAEVQPTWALLENPPGIGDVGLNGILSALEAENYEVQVVSIPACAVNAPHRRERYWIVAHSGEPGHQERELRPGISETAGFRNSGEAFDVGCKIGMAHATGTRPDGQEGQEQHLLGCPPLPARPGDGNGCMGNAEPECDQRRAMQAGGQEGPFGGSDRPVAPEPWSNFVWLPCADGKVRRAPDDSFSLVDGLHRSILGALGNSIVPQVAAEIIKAMIQAEENPSEP